MSVYDVSVYFGIMGLSEQKMDSWIVLDSPVSGKEKNPGQIMKHRLDGIWYGFPHVTVIYKWV